jgi:hypothetical protein
VREWGPLAVIEWIDSCSLSGAFWHAHEDGEQLLLDHCKSVGWILKETKKEIILVPHTTEHSIGGEMCIPKIAITRRWTMPTPKKGR